MMIFWIPFPFILTGRECGPSTAPLRARLRGGRVVRFVFCLFVWVTSARGDNLYLSLKEAPAAVFPGADRFVPAEIASTPALRESVAGRLGRSKTTVWEVSYPVSSAYRGEEPLGDAIVVEEIGKHREITFVVGVTPAGEVAGAAVMTYREPYGGEVRSRRFLRQYEGKGIEDPLVPSRDIRNITGATLSAQAIGRGVKKAIAVIEWHRARLVEGTEAPLPAEPTRTGVEAQVPS